MRGYRVRALILVQVRARGVMRRRRFRGLSRLRGGNDSGFLITPRPLHEMERNGVETSLYTIRPSEYTQTQYMYTSHSTYYTRTWMVLLFFSLPESETKQEISSYSRTQRPLSVRRLCTVYPIFAPATIFPISTLSSSKFAFSVLASSNFLCSFASLINVSSSASCSNNG